MKILPIVLAVEYIASLPGNSDIQVYYNTFNSEIIILEIDDDSLIKPSWKMICQGEPNKFFDALRIALYQHVINR